MGLDEHVLLIAPGHGNSGQGHWQTLLERSHPKAVRVEQKNWNLPTRRLWTAALDRTVRSVAAPMILVGHSAGVSTIVHWAARYPSPSHVVGALLVAPPDMEVSLPGFPPAWVLRLAGWAPIPRQKLPWKTLVVASHNDPFCAIDRARDFASAWGAVFRDVGPAGHINSAAGYGPWPELPALLEALISA
jgi:predicted alpha/beta hydrolase family esterase